MIEWVQRILVATGRWLVEQRWGVAAFVAALVVRLHWNLVIHPPGEFIYSDMNGYLQRAATIFAEGWAPREYNAFYPYGTHVFLYVLQVVFGREAYTAMATVYALLGAGVVWLSYAVACRVSRHRWVPPVLALVLVFYYPLISLGGFFLSEIPFSFCVVAATLFLLRVVEHGRRFDAVAMGIMVALGFTLRPQIMLSVAFIGVFWLLVRRHVPRLRLVHLVLAMVPVLGIMAFSAWRMHHHTGRHGLISENGTFNQVFGRCHNNKIVALPDRPGRSRTSFGPPPFIQLANRERVAPNGWPGLRPAIELEIEYEGYIGDKEIHRQLIARCIEATGWRGQVEYAIVHVALLARYNIMWPDSGRAHWRDLSYRWGQWNERLFIVPALLALFAVFRPRSHVRLGLVGLHVWSVIVLAILYFGDVRFRAPYDPFIMLMALEVHAMVLSWGVARIARLRNRGNKRRVEAVGGPP